jgi:hypothetical protein
MANQGLKILPYGNDENVNAERLDRDFRLLADKINGGLTVDNLVQTFRLGNFIWNDFSVTIPFDRAAINNSGGIILFVAPFQLWITGLSIMMNAAFLSSISNMYIELGTSFSGGAFFNQAQQQAIQLTKLATTNANPSANMNFGIFYANFIRNIASGTTCFMRFNPGATNDGTGSATVNLRSISVS